MEIYDSFVNIWENATASSSWTGEIEQPFHELQQLLGLVKYNSFLMN